MKITGVYLKNFKRFTELSIKEIPLQAKLVVLVGPNGCGKSSVFDAFEMLASQGKGGGIGEQIDYHRKDPLQPVNIEVTMEKGIRLSVNNIAPLGPTIFYIRSPYRYASEIKINQITPLPELRQDDDRPKRTIDIDNRLLRNYQRLIVDPISRLYRGELDSILGKEIRERYLKEINDALKEILGDIQVSDIGDPLDNRRNQLYFTKGKIKQFSFKNLGSGEKEVVDLVIDIIIKKQVFGNTLYCVDEPDLHLNTNIQSKLLRKLLELVPGNSQLWVSTHSLGFIEEAFKLECSSIIDFSDWDFDNSQILAPIEKTRENVRRIYKVALEGLVDFVVPQKIIFCEGENPESDEGLFKIIFQNDLDFRDVEFLYAKSALQTKAAVLSVLEPISRGLSPKSAFAVIDRDYRTSELLEESRTRYVKVLGMYSLESYLLHPNNVKNVDGIVTDEYERFLINKINNNLPNLKEKIKRSVENIGNERAKRRVKKEVESNNQLLNLKSVDKDNLLEIYPWIPMKELLGEVVNWYNQNHRKNGGMYSKEGFLQELAQTLSRNEKSSLYSGLKEILLF